MRRARRASVPGPKRLDAASAAAHDAMGALKGMYAVRAEGTGKINQGEVEAFFNGVAKQLAQEAGAQPVKSSKSGAGFGGSIKKGRFFLKKLRTQQHAALAQSSKRSDPIRNVAIRSVTIRSVLL